VNIVINTSVLLTPATGVGTFVCETARALAAASDAHRYTYYDGRFSDRLAEVSASRCIGTQRLKAMLDRFPSARGLARRVGRAVLPVLSRQTRMSAPPFDLYWEPNYVPDQLDAKRLVVTVHDLSLKTHPEWHPLDRVAHFARHFADGLARPDLIGITADSEFTRGELIDLYRLDPARVKVVTPGCDASRFHPRSSEETAAFRRAKNLPGRFVFFVGSPRDPRKNLPRLLDAWAALPASLRKEFKLVVTGAAASSGRTSSLKSQASSPLFLGYLSPDDLALAYASASALAYPSQYEGFGLPPLEAMASGCPVVASDIPPVREVCRDAAEFVDPLSVEGIAAGLTRVLADDSRRRDLVARGIEQARRFTWNKTARSLLDLFERI
jgi:glycosyltransferase involved in cell wall biosynthesis